MWAVAVAVVGGRELRIRNGFIGWDVETQDGVQGGQYKLNYNSDKYCFFNVLENIFETKKN